MILARFFLLLNGCLMLALGCAFLAAPQLLFGLLTGVEFQGTRGWIDLRATYGGLSAGVGIWLLLTVRLQQWVPVGLMGLVCVYGAFAVGRAAGMVAEGTMDLLMMIMLLVEVLLAVAGALLLWHVRRRED